MSIIAIVFFTRLSDHKHVRKRRVRFVSPQLQLRDFGQNEKNIAKLEVTLGQCVTGQFLIAKLIKETIRTSEQTNLVIKFS